MSKQEALKNVFINAWDRATCFPELSDKWSAALPETGQCAVTALIVQDKFGGEIVYNRNKDHFWNKLPSGKYLDLTRTQFNDVKRLKPHEYVERSTILNSSAAKQFQTRDRYKLLKSRVQNMLSTI